MSDSRSSAVQLLTLLTIATLLLSGAEAVGSGNEDRQPALQSSQSLVAQNSSEVDQALDAFFSSPYDYWDASILAEFWGASITDAKVAMGNKILSGAVGKALLVQVLTDARIDALESVEELRNFADAQYTYDDAAALAEFWGDPSPYEAKLRIEHNLILDQKDQVDQALTLARQG
jgi:hypothetical protein